MLKELLPMQKGHRLQFSCLQCKKPIQFSVLTLGQQADRLQCEQCGKGYSFEDEDLKRQLRKFEALCAQIHQSEEILANTSVGIDVAGQQIKIPYKILLTRLNTLLDLKIGDQSMVIEFRIEPLKDW